MRTFTRYGKCAIADCRKITKQTKTFEETIDMFEPGQSPRVLREPLLSELREWKESELYCECHELEINGNNDNTTDRYPGEPY